MSDAVKIALIMACSTMVLGIVNVIISITHGKKLSDIHVQINSRMDELLRTANAGQILRRGIRAGPQGKITSIRTDTNSRVRGV